MRNKKIKLNRDEVLIPMPITREAAYDFGFTSKDLHYWKIGNRILLVVLVPGTKEVCHFLFNSYATELKKESRDKRCTISNGHGRLIRCPDTNKCDECDYHSSLDKQGYGVVLFSDLKQENDDGALEEFDCAAPDADLSIIYRNEMVEYIAQKQPDLLPTMRLLAAGFTEREIGAKLGIAQPTVNDRRHKIEKLIKESEIVSL